MDLYSGADGLRISLFGGPSNTDESASLGGFQSSSREVRGMTAIYIKPIQGLSILDASPDNGNGIGTVFIDTDGNATYTPPGGSAGSSVAVAEGETKILTGVDTTKYIRVYRSSDTVWKGTATFRLVDMLNGVLSMGDVNDTDRSAGAVYYRAVYLIAASARQDITAWIETDGQSAWALATEEPSGGEIQSIADENTAPTGLSWVNATSRETAIDIGHLAYAESMGLWIRRTFPSSGTAAKKETVNFHIEHKGA